MYSIVIILQFYRMTLVSIYNIFPTVLKNGMTILIILVLTFGNVISVFFHIISRLSIFLIVQLPHCDLLTPVMFIWPNM